MAVFPVIQICSSGICSAAQVRRRQLGRREVVGRERRHQPPVGLFRERLAQVVRAQSGLDVGDRDVEVEGGQGAAERARRVALHDDAVGLQRPEGLGRDRRVRPWRPTPASGRGA